MPTPNKRQAGFTLIELMIAISVLSMILLLTSIGIVNIGNNYYKGITQANTQQAARDILSTVAQNLQFGSYIDLMHTIHPSAGPTMEAECIGNQRYSYITGYQKTSTASAANSTTVTALWRDNLSDTATCAPLNVFSGSPPLDFLGAPVIPGGKELLARNMRLTRFDVAGSSGLYTIKVTVMYGDDDLIDKGPVGTLTADWKCKPVQGLIGGSFCAKSELSTVVGKRVN